MIKIKICGITNPEDAKWAVMAGAEYIGVNLVEGSPRKVSPQMAKKIVQSLPPFVESVAVTANADFDTMKKLIQKVCFKIIQLHGEESADTCREWHALGLGVIKAIRIKDENSLKNINQYIGSVDYLLLDSFQEDTLGGTGKTFLWEHAVKAKEHNIPIILAGGLNSDNISKAIKSVVPYAIDSASGVEKDGHPRKKDKDKLQNFVMSAKAVRI